MTEVTSRAQAQETSHGNWQRERERIGDPLYMTNAGQMLFLEAQGVRTPATGCWDSPAPPSPCDLAPPPSPTARMVELDVHQGGMMASPP